MTEIAVCLPHARAIPFDGQLGEKLAHAGMDPAISELVLPRHTNSGDWLLVFVRLDPAAKTWTADIYDHQDAEVPSNRAVNDIARIADELRQKASPFIDWDRIKCHGLRVPQPLREQEKHEPGVYVVQAAEWLFDVETTAKIGVKRAAIAATLAGVYLPMKDQVQMSIGPGKTTECAKGFLTRDEDVEMRDGDINEGLKGN